MKGSYKNYLGTSFPLAQYFVDLACKIEEVTFAYRQVTWRICG